MSFDSDSDSTATGYVAVGYPRWGRDGDDDGGDG